MDLPNIFRTIFDFIWIYAWNTILSDEKQSHWGLFCWCIYLFFRVISLFIIFYVGIRKIASLLSECAAEDKRNRRTNISTWVFQIEMLIHRNTKQRIRSRAIKFIAENRRFHESTVCNLLHFNGGSWAWRWIYDDQLCKCNFLKIRIIIFAGSFVNNCRCNSIYRHLCIQSIGRSSGQKGGFFLLKYFSMFIQINSFFISSPNLNRFYWWFLLVERLYASLSWQLIFMLTRRQISMWNRTIGCRSLPSLQWSSLWPVVHFRFHMLSFRRFYQTK